MALDGSVLLVDDDRPGRSGLATILAEAGFASVTVGHGSEAVAWLERSTPALVVLDLAPLEGGEPPPGLAALAAIRGEARLAEVPVLALVPGDSEDHLGWALRSGVDDALARPVRPAELVARVRGQARLREQLERLAQREQDARTVLELTHALALARDVRELLFTVVARLARLTGADRCSIVLVDDDDTTGFVVASSDDDELRQLPIELRKYPEVREVLATGQPLGIQDATAHPLLAVVREAGAPLTFASLALVPIVHEHRPLGVVFLRSRSTSGFGDYDVTLVQTVANATAIALRNARALESLREQTHESTIARVEAERRVQLLERYADFFESAAEGMLVFDRDGRILFANSRAREITGRSDEELEGAALRTLVTEAEAPRIERLLAGFRAGVYPREVDQEAASSNGARLLLSVSYSSALHEQNAVVMSFRDVTRERATAVELVQTKEFLERVIESSVDGILSADLAGNILIFNRAACRIFGYSATQVVGTLNIERLYPPGVAREVMRKIRDPRISGHGRLEGYRVEMVGAGDRRIPVSLSAALLMEDDRVAGSVGIVTDLRETVQMEQRLRTAQEALREREKQALVVELAGGAAHELNQPLTSVLNYATLLLRRLDSDAQLRHAAEVIATESERMAEIVRRIGRITHYETKPYVGEQRILDLERASETPDDAPGTLRPEADER